MGCRHPHRRLIHLHHIMKTTIHAIILLALVLWTMASCSPAPATWTGPNPLDTPDTYVSPPESMGRFGPHAEYYTRQP